MAENVKELELKLKQIRLEEKIKKMEKRKESSYPSKHEEEQAIKRIDALNKAKEDLKIKNEEARVKDAEITRLRREGLKGQGVKGVLRYAKESVTKKTFGQSGFARGVSSAVQQASMNKRINQEAAYVQGNRQLRNLTQAEQLLKKREEIARRQQAFNQVGNQHGYNANPFAQADVFSRGVQTQKKPIRWEDLQ